MSVRMRERAKLAADWSGNGSIWLLALRQSEWTRVWAMEGSESQTTESFVRSSWGRAAILECCLNCKRRSKACWGHTNCHSWQITVVLNLGLQRHRARSPQSGFLAIFWKGLGGKTNRKQTTSTWETKCSVLRFLFFLTLGDIELLHS